jgi:hypothetical protein
MNLRSQIAELPVSCYVITSDNKDKLKLGNMEIKRFYVSNDNISNASLSIQDEEINTFLKDTAIYILQFAQIPLGNGHVIVITHRKILGFEKE